MIKIKFKNLEKSEFIKQVVSERISLITQKFQDLNPKDVVVTVEMENSPFQAGPDLFNVKIHVTNGKYKEVTVTKSSSSLYKALADIVDHMLERLNRSGDRKRVKAISKARKVNDVMRSNVE